MGKRSRVAIFSFVSAPMVRWVLRALLAIGVLLIAGAYTRYWYIHTHLIPEVQRNLAAMAEKRATQIQAYIKEQEKQVAEISTYAQTSQALEILAARPANEKNKVEEFSSFIKPYQESFGFKNLLLIAADGSIVFSTKGDEEVGIKLTQDPHQNTPLGHSFMRVMMTMAQDVSSFSFDPILKMPALFISMPVFKDTILLGVLAVQVNEEKIYSIARNYTGLQKTGETVLGKLIGTGALIVAPTRHDPDIALKKQSLFLRTVKIPIEYAVLGEKGTGTGVDYRGKKIVVAWQYLPKIDWGMVVKIDLDEVRKPIDRARNLCILLVIITLFLSFLFGLSIQKELAKFITTLGSMPPFIWIPKTIRLPLWIVFTLSIGAFFFLFYHLRKIKAAALEQTQTSAKIKVEQAIQLISGKSYKIESLAQSIADDLSVGRLKKEDLVIRMERDMQENTELACITIAFAPFAYDAKTKLYAPSVIRANSTFEQRKIEEIYDYTQPEVPGKPKTSWYTKSLESGPMWFEPYQEPASGKHVVAYSVPFYQKMKKDKKEKAIGVVSLLYALDDINTIAAGIDIGQTGYAFVLSRKGTFIYHPIEQYVRDKKTIVDFAQERASEKLQRIGEQVVKGQKILDHFYNEATARLFWTYIAPITTTNWSLGIMFAEDEIDISTDVLRHHYFWMLICVIFALIIMGGLICHIEDGVLVHLRNSSIIASIVLLAGLSFSWRIVQQTAGIRGDGGIMVVDEPGLLKFLDEMRQEAASRFEKPPIAVPSGIFLYLLDFPDISHIVFSGYVWQKYRADLQKLDHGFRLPQAIEFNITKAFEAKEDSTQTIGWEIDATIFQEHDYSKFPFDVLHIGIPLEHKDLIKNIVLIPDITDYKKIKPELLPGIDKEFSISGFDIERAFFSFDTTEPDTSFGLVSYEKITQHLQLTYNIVLKRKLLNPFVLYLLPLLVILFSVFSIFLVTGRRSNNEKKKVDAFKSLGPYTGLFFALIILHRILREHYSTGDTLYLEYFFFSTYITILLLVIHAVLAHKRVTIGYFHQKLSPVLKTLFWPVQLSLWFIATIITFYN